MAGYPVPSQTDIRDNILRDRKNLNTDEDTKGDSDNWVRASATSNAIAGLYAHQSWIVKQIFPHTADEDMVLQHAAVRGMSQLAATISEGNIRVSGTPGTPVPILSASRNSDIFGFASTATAVIGVDGTVIIPAKASSPGVLGNSAPGDVITLVSTPAGVDSVGEIVTMIGGTDVESVSHLLGRLLDVIRHPPAGGNRYDYRRWAMEVPGVLAAYVYPLRRGAGTVDVLVTAEDGLPSQSVVLAVRAHIDDVRPAGLANLWVGVPLIKPVNFRIALAVDAGDAEDYQPTVQAVLARWMAQFTPGDTTVKSQAEAIISGIAGVTDRSILLPVANVVPENSDTTVEWCQLGTVEIVPL